MAVKLWMVVVGTAIVIHAGNMITAEKHAAMEEAEGFHEDVTGVTFQVFVEVVVGSLLALWGGIGGLQANSSKRSQEATMGVPSCPSRLSQLQNSRQVHEVTAHKHRVTAVRDLETAG
eukprot:CAMPEP_0181461012 /NCGR_PEP_ID=MMETSP1110-20121109/33647_1 /TAXON_ID=174948 /ORGANISM="Symbiodinium sp., Strain CCMP421" /LENGTH=117 /DNA_ID=CAMNT_0023585601 /DNA_START=43 /DNA_END=392 /DNA_ORIENTATION=+